MPDNPLPPSLATVPNIPVSQQTIDQLRAEQAYWSEKIISATCWGAALTAAFDFRHACEQEIIRRNGEARS